VAVSTLAKQVMAILAGKSEPKPKADTKLKPNRSRPKKVSTVVEVERICGVRHGKNGGVEYHVRWKGDPEMTWEPEDNILDDDLIDDFEADQQAKVYGQGALKVGAVVEVKNDTEGFQNSWTAASVICKEQGNLYTVEYTSFVDGKGKKLREKRVPRNRLRIPPTAARSGWTPRVGDIIEVNEDDCWWEARVLELKGKKVLVKFRVSDEEILANLGPKARACSWLSMSD